MSFCHSYGTVISKENGFYILIIEKYKISYCSCSVFQHTDNDLDQGSEDNFVGLV